MCVCCEKDSGDSSKCAGGRFAEDMHVRLRVCVRACVLACGGLGVCLCVLVDVCVCLLLCVCLKDIAEAS